jgi:AcrR family transcriptional regulator
MKNENHHSSRFNTMNIRIRTAPEETRLRIMDVAEEQFRRVGYAKTAVADIADALGMSPANIYRFFASKGAINEAICLRILSEGHDIMDGVIKGGGPAGDRLKTLLIEMHRFNRSRYVGERRVHDMVEAAMEQNWSAVEAHFAFVLDRFARLIVEGVQAGEFRPCDPAATAMTIKNCCTAILHPNMIAECMSHGRDMEEHAERISSFVVDALKTRPNERAE